MTQKEKEFNSLKNEYIEAYEKANNEKPHKLYYKNGYVYLQGHRYSCENKYRVSQLRQMIETLKGRPVKEEKNELEKISWTSKDKSLNVTLLFIVGVRLKLTHVGKTYPKHTQCLLFINGILDHFATVVKHKKDCHNQAFAYKVAAERCLKQLANKETRNEVRKLLDKQLKGKHLER